MINGDNLVINDEDDLDFDLKKMKKILMKGKLLLSVIILGDISVGKTNIVRRILGQDFSDQEATVGAEFGFYEAVKLDEEVKLIIQLWDTCK